MMDKETQGQILANMDQAAVQAKQEFTAFPEEAKQLMSEWMRNWYLKAGYRRLGRIMVAYAKDQSKEKNKKDQ